ncbi:MAG TPA: hypothetical protein VMV10_06755 [Pirellulales bacterium]|nr:hypothetical protein [Pirellulales bacterium]
MNIKLQNIEKLRGIIANEDASEDIKTIASAVIDVYERITNLKADDDDMVKRISQLEQEEEELEELERPGEEDEE